MSAPDFASLTHTRYEAPICWWRYTDCFARAGFRDRAGKKHILGAVRIDHQCYWHEPMPPWPIYNTAALAVRPDAPVLALESECLADAASLLFPDHVCVSWPRGCDGVLLAIMAPFTGRDVVLWPDRRDGTSVTAMSRLQTRLRTVARSVVMVAAPRDWHASWLDCVPQLPDATLRDLRRVLHDAGASRRARDAALPGRPDGTPASSEEGASISLPDAGVDAAGVIPVFPAEATVMDDDREDDDVVQPLPPAEFVVPSKAQAPTAAMESQRDPGPWPTPDLALPDDRRGELPSFPRATLPSFWQSWTAQAAAGARAPVDHVALALLAVAAGLIGGARRIAPSPAWSEPCVLWTALVDTALPGKPAGMAAALRPLRALNGDLAAANAAASRRHRTALVTARAETWWWMDGVRGAVANCRPAPEMPAATEEPPPFAPRQLVVDDPGALVDALQGSARGTLLALGAVADWLGNTACTVTGRHPAWPRWWSADSWLAPRNGRPAAGAPRGIAIPCAAVSVVGMLPASAIVPALARGGTLASRFLFAWSDRAPRRSLVDTVPADGGGARAALARLRDLPDTPRDLPLSAAALAAFDAFECDLDADPDPPQGWAADWRREGPGIVLRLAGVLAYLKWAAAPADDAEPDDIPRAAIEAAVDLWRTYLWPHAQAVLRVGGGDAQTGHVREALRWLAEKRPPEVSLLEIRRQALHKHVDAEGAGKVIEELVARGCLRLMTYATGGHPRHRWQVNPVLLQDFPLGAQASRPLMSGDSKAVA